MIPDDLIHRRRHARRLSEQGQGRRDLDFRNAVLQSQPDRAHSIDERKAVQRIDYEKLKQRLLDDKQVLK